jgi:hypothetical protein
VFFLIDSSTSIESAIANNLSSATVDSAFDTEGYTGLTPTYDQMIEVQQRFVAKKLGMEGVRIGLVQYTAEVNTADPNAWALNNYSKAEEVLLAFGRLKWISGGPISTSKAIKYGQEQLESGQPLIFLLFISFFCVGAGARHGVPKVMVLVTDGEPVDKELTIYEAQRARNQGTHLFVMAYGPEANRSSANEYFLNLVAEPADFLAVWADVADYHADEYLATLSSPVLKDLFCFEPPPPPTPAPTEPTAAPTATPTSDRYTCRCSGDPTAPQVDEIATEEELSSRCASATAPLPTAAVGLPLMWSNPIKRPIKCRNYAHHWTSAALYEVMRLVLLVVSHLSLSISLVFVQGIKSMSQCDNGVEVHHECHGAGLAVGLYQYLEGYEGWDHMLAEGDEYSLVCSGLDVALLWDIGGPLHGCGIWKGGQQIGTYHGTWRGGGLNVRLLLWGYKCKVKRVRMRHSLPSTGGSNATGFGLLAMRPAAFTDVPTTTPSTAPTARPTKTPTVAPTPPPACRSGNYFCWIYSNMSNASCITLRSESPHRVNSLELITTKSRATSAGFWLLYCFLALVTIVLGYFCTFYLVSSRDNRGKSLAPTRTVDRQPKASSLNDWGSFFATSLPPSAQSAVEDDRRANRTKHNQEGHESNEWTTERTTHSMPPPRMHEPPTVLQQLELQQLESDPVQGAQLVDMLGHIDRYGL